MIAGQMGEAGSAMTGELEIRQVNNMNSHKDGESVTNELEENKGICVIYSHGFMSPCSKGQQLLFD